MSVRALPSAAFLLVLFLPLTGTAQDIWFVDDDGNPGTGCISWEDACPLLGDWGPCPDPADCPPDLDGDGQVNAFDLAILLGNWG